MPTFPGNTRFAFTVIDDTDVATVANVAPVYRMLEALGMRTTKTVWPLDCPGERGDYDGSQTLEDDDYVDFIVDLRRRGFEVTWHGATMSSSQRSRTLRALERYRDVLGDYPRIHVNHSENRENLYWGADRIDAPILRRIMRELGLRRAGSEGNDPGSAYWWGDLCREHITYARNLTFDDINLLNANPTLPYRDPARSLVPWWFSASDADNVLEFNWLLRPENQARLEREGGVCIVATHFGKGFARKGRVHATTYALLSQLAQRQGWFVPVGTLLDWLREKAVVGELGQREWRRMQWRWFRDLVMRRVRGRKLGDWKAHAELPVGTHNYNTLEIPEVRLSSRII